MKVYGITVKDWAARYQIKTDPLPCFKCKAPIELVQPIAIKGYRGLQTDECPSCEELAGAFVVVPVGADEKNFWYEVGRAI